MSARFAAVCFAALGGCDWGYADVWGINIAGVVTGDYTTGGTTAAYRTHGFRDGTTLDYPGAVSTLARGINGAFDMDVVGFYRPQQDSGVFRGFLFNLGTFSPIDVPGSSLTMPSAINDARDIVGTYRDTAGVSAGFVWPRAPDGTASRITDGISQMQQALGNNEAGQIVGIVVSPSATRFVLATPSAPPTMSLDRTSLAFAAVNSGAAFTSQTSTQTVRLTQTGAGSVSWTATSTASWLAVSPASGSGSTTLTISTRFASGLAASQTGSIPAVWKETSE